MACFLSYTQLKLKWKDVKSMDTKRLKQARKAKNYTQKFIAEQLQIDITAYSNWERGINNPTLSRLEKLAELLEVTPNYLMGQEEDAIPLKHQDIFELYLELSEEEKAAIDTMIRTMAAKK